MKYLIHTCKNRLWYVNDYLIPSMVEQGIIRNNICVYLDSDEEGCLESCMKSFMSVPNNNDGTWHLQDDVIICQDFKQRTEQFDAGVVCGYSYALDGRSSITGIVKSKNMWYSFPCIRIPNRIARNCARWYFKYVKTEKAYRVYVRSKKHDDTLFHIFMEDYYPDETVLNLTPNLVDHIDYLIGGSVINGIRPEKETHAAYFEDNQLIEKLKEKLQNNS